MGIHGPGRGTPCGIDARGPEKETPGTDEESLNHNVFIFYFWDPLKRFGTPIMSSNLTE